MVAKETSPESEPRASETGVQTASVQVGDAQVRIQAAFPKGTSLRITLDAISEQGREQKRVVLGQHIPAGAAWRTRLHWLLQRLRSLGWEGALLALSLLVYLGTRLFAISDYPIYFFTDEAVQTLLAADLVRDGFHSYDGEFLPTYFYNGYQYNLSASVYLQVLPYMLLGKSVALTRGLAAATTLLGAFALGLIVWKVFKVPHAWSAVLLLSITPAWFLHSRTAFETSLAVTFYAVFLYCYLEYRSDSPRYLYPAVLAGALTFYAYSPARVVIGLTALLLFFSDLRYHLKNWRTVLPGLGLALLAAVPLLRFMLQHPDAGMDHLRVLNSYWVQPIPALEKLQIYAQEYLQGLNPLYWYLPNGMDLERHKMDSYGHVFWFTLPLMLVGLAVAVRKIRQPAYRAVLIALLAAPAGAALVALGITRALVMVVPLALLSALGLASLLGWLATRWKALQTALPPLCFGLLVGVNLFMTADALAKGPYWHTDYGLGGMQWGGKQLFGEIKAYLAQHPDARLIVSPSWANGTDTVARFFFDDPLPFEMASIEGYFNEKKPLDENTLFVMIPREYELMLESGKFTAVRIEKWIPYPDGQPGFYFVRLRYVDQIDQILAAEREQRRVLQQASVDVGSETWQVKYSYLDMGSIDKAFDGDPETLIRTMEANPMVVQVAFPSSRPLGGLSVRVGGTPTSVRVSLTTPEGEVHSDEQSVAESPTPREVVFSFEQPIDCTQLQVEVRSTRDQEPAHVHLWEIEFTPAAGAEYD